MVRGGGHPSKTHAALQPYVRAAATLCLQAATLCLQVGIVELGEATLKLSQPPTPAGGEGSAGPVEPPSPLVLRVEVTMVGATVLVHP